MAESAANTRRFPTVGLGETARVENRESLAEAILEQLEEARDGYAPQLDFEIPARLFNFGDQPSLPLQIEKKISKPS